MHRHGLFVRTKNPDCTFYSWPPDIIQISLVFLLMSYFYSRIQSICHTAQLSCLLTILLIFSMFFMNFTVLRSTGQVFCNRPSILNFLIFLWLNWAYKLLGGRAQCWSTLLFTSSQSPHMTSLVTLNLITWSWTSVPDFFIESSISLSLLYSVHSSH